MEKTITMPLSEYESITSENQRMKKILKNKEGIAFELRSEHMGMGWIRNTFNLLTKDSLVESLINQIKELQIAQSNVSKELYELKNATKKKSFF